MSLEYIIQKIIADANEFADDIIGKAKEEAQIITVECESSSEKEYNQIVNLAYEKANEILHRSTAQGVKEKRISIISKKWEYLDSVFSSAVDLMCDIPRDEKIRFIVSLILKYQRSDAEAIFNAADRDILGHDVIAAINSSSQGHKLTLSDTTGDFSGGVILKEAGIEVNLTFDTIVASKREQLEDDVSSILFGDAAMKH